MLIKRIRSYLLRVQLYVAALYWMKIDFSKYLRVSMAQTKTNNTQKNFLKWTRKELVPYWSLSRNDNKHRKGRNLPNFMTFSIWVIERSIFCEKYSTWKKRDTALCLRGLVYCTELKLEQRRLFTQDFKIWYLFTQVFFKSTCQTLSKSTLPQRSNSK